MGLASIFWWRDELPDETLDVLISTVVKQTKYQDDTAYRLHIPLAQTPLTPGMGEDVPPAAPPGEEGEKTKNKTQSPIVHFPPSTRVGHLLLGKQILAADYPPRGEVCT